MSWEGQNVVHHPVAQVAAAGMVLSSLPTNVGMVAAGLASVYYSLVILDYVRNWKPTSAQPGSVQSILGRVAGIWAQDKPYIAAFLIVGMAAISAAGIPIPNWVVMLAAAAGVGSMHSFVRNTGDIKP